MTWILVFVSLSTSGQSGKIIAATTEVYRETDICRAAADYFEPIVKKATGLQVMSVCFPAKDSLLGRKLNLGEDVMPLDADR